VSASRITASDTLLELFRVEVERNGSALNEGLLAIESDVVNPARIELLMRAAHSIKGAARIIGVESVTRLAHAMEDCFVASGEGRLVLDADRIDLLLEATDLLGGLAEASGSGAALEAWEDAHQAAVDSLVQQLPLPASAKQSPAVASPTPARPQRTEPVAASPRDASDPVVRVAAGSIDRLLGLAGETLVEARRAQPLAESLRVVIDLQASLVRTLDELGHALRETAGDPRLVDLLGAAAARASECRQLIVDREHELDGFARRLDDASNRLHREVLSSRMRPFSDGTHGFPRMARDVARQLGRAVKLEIIGLTTRVDRDVLDRLEAPLEQIIRNAIGHGIEPAEERVAAGKPEAGTIRIEASHRAGMLFIAVSDDGRGIDLERIRRRVVERGMVAADTAARFDADELMEFIFVPGLSTVDEVTDISGRGVGLDVVQTTAQETGGSVRVLSELGKGTRFELQLPLTLSVTRAVVVDIADEPYALPLTRIDRILRIPAEAIRTLEGRPYFTLENHNVALVPARRILDLPGVVPDRDELCVVVVCDRSQRYGLVVERFLGEHDLVVRPLDPRLGKVADISAAAILNDGAPLLIIDVDDMVRSIEKLLHGHRYEPLEIAVGDTTPKRRKRVLVVDDSIIVREVERQLLVAAGYEVVIAVDGMDAWNCIRSEVFDLVVSDIDMPRLNGIELVRRIKQDSALKSLPVVIVSYKDREEDRTRGLDAGASAYLTKSSFHDEMLIRTVDDLIGEPGE
jgi:two-component system, chemotaxis family, sensor histidine kinase and response regulator WspE